MEVKTGYKQTEVGIIPEDWDMKSINTVASIVGGGTPSTQVDAYWNGRIPWVAAGDISNAGGRYIKQTEFHISELGLSNSSTKIMPKGTTIIIARGATVGRMAQFGKDMAFNQTCYCLVPNNRLDKNYLYYSMLFSVNAIIAMSFGTIFGTITTNSFRDWYIPLPPLAEQEAIAEALSDADALIEALEQLIAKKRQVKQGAMQELLTGKRRLSGFSNEWKTKKFGDIASVYSGGTPSTEIAAYYGGEIPWITSSDLNKGFVDDVDGRITKMGLENSSAKMVNANTLLVALYGATAGVTAITRLRAAINQAVLAVIPNKDNYMFLFYKLGYLKDWIITTYTQGGQPNLSGEIVKSIEITLPEPNEQTAIAEILSDMGAEIAALEGKLVKAREVKQGMMSMLLTGRVRLV